MAEYCFVGAGMRLKLAGQQILRNMNGGQSSGMTKKIGKTFKHDKQD